MAPTILKSFILPVSPNKGLLSLSSCPGVSAQTLFSFYAVLFMNTMKFEDYLMQQQHTDDKQRRHHLTEEVEKLEAELDEQQTINKVLHSALHGPVSANPCLTSSLLPPQVHVQVQGLIAELAMVEEEVMRLERKVDEMKLTLYKERKQTGEWKQHRWQKRLSLKQHKHLLPPSGSGHRSVLKDDTHHLSRSQHYKEFRKEKWTLRRASVGSEAEMLSTFSPEDEESSRKVGMMQKGYIDAEICNSKPNELSEELIKCLIGIFLDLNKGTQDMEGSPIVPKLSLSCMTSKSSKSSFNCKASLLPNNHNASNLDPYGIMPDLDSTIRDIGPYKNFIHITRNSLELSCLQESLLTTGKLRALIHELASVDLTFLTYKQKLAFWINIYNTSIMHAFLEHGLPSSQEKQLAIMNKAALNVGGVVLNALAIEHFILRYPREAKQGPGDEKEMLLRHTYGVGYPEPNVTFALCRGSWSSPALRVYTPDAVVNELSRAKVEYLEASVGVTSKRKIIVPKLLQWYMRDFADDMGSLVEWIYSQLPRSALLKRLMMESLNGESKSPRTKMIEIQPYEYEFRYLLTL